MGWNTMAVEGGRVQQMGSSPRRVSVSMCVREKEKRGVRRCLIFGRRSGDVGCHGQAVRYLLAFGHTPRQ